MTALSALDYKFVFLARDDVKFAIRKLTGTKSKEMPVEIPDDIVFCLHVIEWFAQFSTLTSTAQAVDIVCTFKDAITEALKVDEESATPVVLSVFDRRLVLLSNRANDPEPFYDFKFETTEKELRSPAVTIISCDLVALRKAIANR